MIYRSAEGPRFLDRLEWQLSTPFVGARRRVAILVGLLLALGFLSGIPGTPLGALAAKASVSAGDIVFVQTVPGDNPYNIKTPASSSTPTDLSYDSTGDNFT